MLAWAAGCDRSDTPVVDHSVLIQVAAHSARLKIVEENSVGEALVTIATTTNLSTGIPESRQDEFFNMLPVAKGFEGLTLGAAGEVTVKRLRGQHFVVARAGQSLWVVAASDTRDSRLRLGDQNVGGLHAVDAALARTNIVQMLTAASHRALTRRQFAQARLFAQSARANAVVTQIDRAEAYGLVDQGEEAFRRKEYDTARNLAKQAEAIVPGFERAQALLTKIFDEAGGELRSFHGHDGAVTCVVLSPDGTLALSASADRTLKLWDVATGQEVRTFKGHRDTVTSVAFGPDGKLAASGSNDSTLRLWNVATGEELGSGGGLGWKVTSVAFSPDARSLATGGDDNQVKLWALPAIQPVQSFRGHSWKVTSVTFSPDGNSLLSGSEDSSAKLWNVTSGGDPRTLQNGFTPVICLALSPDGRFALLGGKDGVIKLWNLSGASEVLALRGHAQPVRSVAFSPDGRLAISGSDDGTVRLWDLSTGKELRTFTAHGGPVASVAFSPNGRFVLSGGMDATVRLWQLPHTAWPTVQEAKQ